MEPVYTVVNTVVVGSFHGLGWRVLVEGAEHLPASGAAVLATNHIGYLDFTFVGYAARRRGRLVRFLAKQEVFDRGGVGWLMHAMHHIPVDRYGRATEAFDCSVEALRRGELVGMFPEATISPSFQPKAAKSGAARMAQAAGVPLIPGAVWGSQRILTKGRPPNLQRGVAMGVVFGPPLPYEPGEDAGAVTRRLMAAIAGHVAHLQATYPQQPRGDADRWWLPAALGGTAPTPQEAELSLAAEAAQRRAARRSRT